MVNEHPEGRQARRMQGETIPVQLESARSGRTENLKQRAMCKRLSHSKPDARVGSSLKFAGPRANRTSCCGASVFGQSCQHLRPTICCLGL